LKTGDFGPETNRREVSFSPVRAGSKIEDWN